MGLNAEKRAEPPAICNEKERGKTRKPGLIRPGASNERIRHNELKNSLLCSAKNRRLKKTCNNHTTLHGFCYFWGEEMFVNFPKGCSWSRLAMMVAGLLFVFVAQGQNVVLVKSPDYLVFRWGNETRTDTLDTAGISEFLVFMGKADSVDAAYVEQQVVYFLKRSPTLVDSVDSAMRRSLFIGLDEYRDWLNLEQKKVKIVKQ